ncbi:hypothetical protein ACHAW6_001827 [Cyclotella cf. meneghiniana]
MPVHELVAVVEIQQLWRKYSCRKFIRSLGVNADKSSVIIQSKFWRAEICRRYYLIIRDAVKNQSEDGRRDNLLVQLIDAKCIESLSYQPDWNKMLTFRIDSTTWPPLLVYKSLDNKVLVDFDGGNEQRSDVHVNHPKFNFTTEIMEEMRQAPWNIVDPEIMAVFIGKELKKMRQRSKRKKEHNSRQSKTKDVKQLRREKMRKKSQLKWKWFYDGHLDHNTLTLSDGEEESTTNDDAYTEHVVAWLVDLELNAQKYDIDLD